VTLGYTRASTAVQAGDDLIDVLRLKSRRVDVGGPGTCDHQAVLYYHGDGQCSVQLSQPIHVNALFSPCY